MRRSWQRACNSAFLNMLQRYKIGEMALHLLLSQSKVQGLNDVMEVLVKLALAPPLECQDRSLRAACLAKRRGEWATSSDRSCSLSTFPGMTCGGLHALPFSGPTTSGLQVQQTGVSGSFHFLVKTCLRYLRDPLQQHSSGCACQSIGTLDIGKS